MHTQQTCETLRCHDGALPLSHTCTCAPVAESADTLRWLAVQEKAHEALRVHPDWRWGQALFNALHALDPDLANQIRGTAADPFHDATRAPEFMEAVMRGLITPPGTAGGGSDA